MKSLSSWRREYASSAADMAAATHNITYRGELLITTFVSAITRPPRMCGREFWAFHSLRPKP
jgi:hypothetical protein